MNYNVFALLHWISAVIWVITVCHRVSLCQGPANEGHSCPRLVSGLNKACGTSVRPDFRLWELLLLELQLLDFKTEIMEM